MLKPASEIHEAWKTIILFLLLLIAFSAIAYFAILKLNPTSIYVGLLMISPALAAFLTLKIKGRPISGLPWILGLGHFMNPETVDQWANELGIDSSDRVLVIAVMTFLLLTVGVIKNLGSALGEETGWRGFLIFELRKVMSFKALSIVSGIIWAVWHYPVIILIYGKGENLWMHMGSFTAMIIGISVILAYFTFKSNSLWPAAIFHSIHNIYIQKICTPLTLTHGKTEFWIDEYGLMIPMVTTVLAVYFWRKAGKENL